MESNLKQTDLPAIPEIEKPPLLLGQLVFLRFKRHKMAVAGVFILILLIFYAIGGSFFKKESYSLVTDTSIRLNAPSAGHPFGTDAIGRDILTRTIYGGQISLMIGLVAMVVEVIIGVLIGALAGYYGGFLDSILMRFTEAMLNIPQIPLLLVLGKMLSDKIKPVMFFGREFSGSVIVIIAVIGLTSWMGLARVVRANFLSLREQEYVTAARCTGTNNWSIIFGHILPNTMAPIIVSATLSSQCHHQRSLCQLFRGWGDASNSNLGKYA
jgi:peptide/nickel transport system permease protein